MKFICPSCKAKYQISDEKVQDKSVRMRCRKCAKLIQIDRDGAILVGGHGESKSTPPSQPAPKVANLGPPPRPAAGGADPPPKPTSIPKTVPARPAPAVRAAPSAPRAALSVPRAAPSSPRAAASAAKPLAAPRRTPIPREASKPEPSPKAHVGTSPRSSPEVAGVSPPSSPSPLAPAVSPSPAPASTSYSGEDDEATRVADSSALASAFSAAVAAPAAPAVDEEWFVGINGVPVGPLKKAELRAKALSGAASKESLVWREGFEEWKPLGTFPELAQLVDEAISGRSSDVPGPLGASLAAASPRPAPVAIAAGSGVAVESQEDLEALAGLTPKRRIPIAPIFAIAVAIAFGLVIGIVFNSPEAPKEIVKYVTVPAETEKASDGKSEQDAATTEANNPEETPEKAQTGDQKKAGGGSGKHAAGVPKAEEPKSGLKGLTGLSGLAPGPTQGPAGNSPSTGSAGRALDSATLESTVNRYKGSVKRSCWQPALDTRDKDAPTSARVGVTITVGASGSVQNVTTTGDPRGYRGLASCIGRRVRGWQFPASSGTTTVNVPFVFAAQ